MKINWKVRFKSKIFLSALVSLVIMFVYNVLALFEITPAVEESVVKQVAEGVLMMLAMMGVIVDPTTEGLFDSERAMGYDKPWKEEGVGGEGD